MGVKEKDLPVAENINEGDKVRIVTSEGSSEQVDVSKIGGGGNIEVIMLSPFVACEYSEQELRDILASQKALFMVKTTGNDGLPASYPAIVTQTKDVTSQFSGIYVYFIIESVYANGYVTLAKMYFDPSDRLLKPSSAKKISLTSIQ